MRVYQSLPASLHHGISCWLRISSARRPRQHAALTGAEFQDSRALLPALSINTLGAARPSRIQPLLCIPNVASDRGHDTFRGACAENEMSVARTRLTLGHYIAAVAAVVVVVCCCPCPCQFPCRCGCYQAIVYSYVSFSVALFLYLLFCCCCFCCCSCTEWRRRWRWRWWWWCSCRRPRRGCCCCSCTALGV